MGTHNFKLVLLKMFVKLLLFAIVLRVGDAVGDAGTPAEYKLKRIQDLKDLLTLSVDNTISLNAVVTAQTQQISELMIAMSSNKVEMDALNAKYSEALDKIALLEAKDKELDAKDKELEVVTDDLRSDLELVENPVTILNGEEANGNPKCARVCSGSTGRGTTTWSSFYVNVDITSCGFVKIPTITTSLEGTGGGAPYMVTSGIWSTTTTGFTLYVGGNDRTSYVSSNAAGWKWNIEWIAVGFTC